MRLIVPLLFLLASGAVAAQELRLEGFADLRLVRPAEEGEWTGGGLGKLRYGRGGDSGLRFGEASVVGTALLGSEFTVRTHLRAEPTQRTPLDVVEAYARYRPVSTTPWRWSVKGGAFFPPISLENDGIGWTTPWTLTPSAINTWVGEELRTLGGEGRLEWRGAEDHVELMAALFGGNDPAGILLAYRGWTLHDRPTGLFDRPRLPDETGRLLGLPLPATTAMFREIDDRLGWYAGVRWQREGIGGLSVLHYDNRADPGAFRGQFAWRTEFWSAGVETAGVETAVGEVVLLAQAMRGETEVSPGPTVRSLTTFEAIYLLAGWDFGDWRAAVRGEVFGSRERSLALRPGMSEHGHALTLALTWRPTDRLRITAEALRVDSVRSQRISAGLPARAEETLLQLGARVFF